MYCFACCIDTDAYELFEVNSANSGGYKTEPPSLELVKYVLRRALNSQPSSLAITEIQITPQQCADD